jgi:shikimate kinase
MKIYLVGYPCCGKSTIGKKLANRLNYKFLDLDSLFEAKFNTSIESFMERFGENDFRIIEHELLKYCSSSPLYENTVIATGGGAPCFFDNMQIINNSGLSIFLDISWYFIIKRLENAKKQRPLFAGIAKEDLKPFVKKQLEERKEFYTKSSLTYNVKKSNIDDLILEVKKILENAE